jgi:hypothetical protein
MYILTSIANCLCGADDDQPITFSRVTEKTRSDDEIAAELVEKLFTAEKAGENLKSELRGVVGANGWSEYLAEAFYNALQAAIEAGKAMGPVMKEAYDRVVHEAEKIPGIIENHPVLCALIVLGIITLLTPLILELLGFGAEGIIEGSPSLCI